MTVPFSVLDLSPIVEGGTAAEALRNTLELARHAESLRYKRYWLAEHHNMTGIASAATAVVIGHVAGGTRTIRVGSGGIMLPNHSPLVVAEQFGTLESLFPGRIDLGLGRAPGTDQQTSRALRRDLAMNADEFPQDVLELQGYFNVAEPGQRIRAVPGVGLKVPLWILGSSLFGAQVAAMFGLPFAFASHFAPDALMPALEIYRKSFKPSQQLAQPYAMVAANIVAADTDAEARRLFTSLQQAFIRLRRGSPGPLPPPIDNIDAWASPVEKEGLNHSLIYSFVGAPATVAGKVQSFLKMTQADELIVSGQVFDPAARLRSYELAARVRDMLP
ncbi:MAG: luciferase-like monooxygenase family protein [Gammaproteobacteria bacterium]|nr:luciferase-like monooxygenase family protein [Gammaproteobacteria bacterium]